MSPPDNQVEIVPQKGWRFKCGIVIFIFALLLWCLIPLAASLDVPGSRIAALSATVFIANKILLIACIAVMGKDGFQQLKAIVFGRAKRLAPVQKVGPVRHAIGLVMFILPLLTATLEPYIDTILPGFRPNLWQFQVLGDLMFIGSFFVLGGDFWSKLRGLFIRTV